MANESVDLILSDPPYGITNEPWDVPLPTQEFWEGLRRILKPCGTILMFAMEPFASEMRLAARDLYKYDYVWKKSRKTHFTHCESRPLGEFESILVFGKGNTTRTSKTRLTFNPQKRQVSGGQEAHPLRSKHRRKNNITEAYQDHGCPTNIIDFPSVPILQKTHPCQKPVELIRHLILTHSNEGEMVFDPTFGSGTTLVAAMQTGRASLGFDITESYYQMALERIDTPILTRTLRKGKPLGRPKGSKNKPKIILCSASAIG